MTIGFDYSFFVKAPQLEDVAREQALRDAGSFKLSRKFQFYYRFIRPLMPIIVRQMMQSRRRIEVGENWFTPVRFLEALCRQMPGENASYKMIHPWPNGFDFAFVLTHDVETADGMRNIIALADIEEEFGFRSSWNFVPYKYKIDRGIIRELEQRGFEIGIHGFNHDGQLFFSQKQFERRANRINSAIEEYGAVGFRAPMVHRNLRWLQALNIRYDSSCFDVDPFQAMPGGVGSIWPFMAGKFVELPYTLPQDHTLFVVLGERDERIWIEKLDYLRQHKGMALMLTHPDYLNSPKRMDIYRRFLSRVHNQNSCWHALPREVADWWRAREQFNSSSCQSPLKPDDERFVLAELRNSDSGLQIDPVSVIST